LPMVSAIAACSLIALAIGMMTLGRRRGRAQAGA